MRRLVLLIAGPLMLPLTACTDGSGLEGECTMTLMFDERTYRPVNALQNPLRGEELGSAEVLDCDGAVMEGEPRLTVFELAGEDPDDVLIVPRYGRDDVFLNESMRFRDRPQVLKDSVKFPKCTQPARFIATWSYIDPEDFPHMDDFASALPPYTAVVTTSQGRGLPLDRWSSMTLEIEVTDNTVPTPTPELLTAANDDDADLVVRTQCSGTAFEATSIRLAKQG